MPWKAPANAAGKTIEFRFTAVQTRSLFWTGKLANHTIVVVDSSLDGNETSSMVPTTTESTASTNSTPFASSPINSTTASDCLLTIDCPLTTSVMPPLSPSTDKELTSIKPNTSTSSVTLTKPISVTTSKSPQSTSSVIVSTSTTTISSLISSQLTTTTTTTKVTAVSSPIKSSSTNKPTGWGTGSVTTLKETTSPTSENQVLTNTLWPISSTISTTIIAMNETSTTTLHQPAKNETALTLTTSNLTLATTIKTCSCGGGHITSTTASPTTTTSSSEIILPSILVISVCFLRFLMRT